MNWIHAFELICYGLSAVLITDILRRRDVSELKLFLAGTIAGFALELLAVRVTDIYHYNPDFWLNLGSEPYQFPVFGGLMWGGLSVCALRIASSLGSGKVMTAMTAGFLILRLFKKGTSCSEGREILAVGFFAVMYVYCFAAMIALGIFQQHIWLAVLGVTLFGLTTYMGIKSR